MFAPIKNAIRLRKDRNTTERGFFKKHMFLRSYLSIIKNSIDFGNKLEFHLYSTNLIQNPILESLIHYEIYRPQL